MLPCTSGVATLREMLRTMDARTVHMAAFAKYGQSWDPSELSLSSERTQEATALWDEKRAAVLDEVSLAPAAVYHGLSLRATYARQSALSLDPARYMREWLGKLPIGLHLGDFMQMRPAGRRSLCEVLEHDHAEGAEETAAELGRQLFADCITHVAGFEGTGRFQKTPSGEQLVGPLACMRCGEPAPDDLWAAVEAQAVRPGAPDPRFDEEKFRLGHEGATLWELVSRLQQFRAYRDAEAASAQLFYCQAIDLPQHGGIDWSREDAMEALRIMNMTTTGYLLGLCPLFVGMKVRLTANVQKPLLVRELRGTVREVLLHPKERLPRPPAGMFAPIILAYMPLAVVVELENPGLAGATFCADLPPGHVLITPQEAKWSWRRYLAPAAGPKQTTRRQKLTLEMRRRQLPLAPALVNTHYGLQGQTARQGMIAYLMTNVELEVQPDQAPTAAQENHFLATYVLLSRATQLEDLLIVGLPPRSLFGMGPPPTLRARMRYYAERAAASEAEASTLLKRLGWADLAPEEAASQASASHVPGSASAASEAASPPPSARSSTVSTMSPSDWFCSTQHFEKQRGAHCGMHAVNNAVGEALVTLDALQIAAEAVSQELLRPLVEDISPDGHYSSETLAAALQFTGRWRLELNTIGGVVAAARGFDVLQQPHCAGALVNTLSPCEHWTALRAVDGHVWHLDSLAQPRRLTREECREFLLRHERVYPIFSVHVAAQP